MQLLMWSVTHWIQNMQKNSKLSIGIRIRQDSKFEWNSKWTEWKFSNDEKHIVKKYFKKY